MKKDEFAKSSLLNIPGYHSIAAISIQLKNYGNEKKPWAGISGEMNISDCSRSISLNFDMNNEKERNNAAHKLSTIIEVCKESLDWLNSQDEIAEKEKDD